MAIAAAVVFTILAEMTLLSAGEADHVVWGGATSTKAHGMCFRPRTIFWFMSGTVNKAVFALIPGAIPFDMPDVFAKFACEGFIFFAWSVVNGSGCRRDRRLLGSEVFGREEGGVSGSRFGVYCRHQFYIVRFG